MVVDRIIHWLDNPIIVKHMRSRLRPQALGISVFVVLLLCVLITYYGYEVNSFTNGGAFGALFSLQAIMLAVMGAGQIGSSVINARASGIIDFHRVSPLTATELTLGFFFGGPIREYILVLATMPLAALCVAIGTPSLVEFVQLMIALVAVSWTVQALVLMIAMLSKAKANSNSNVGLGLLFFLLAAPMLAGGRMLVSGISRVPRLSIFGVEILWLFVVLVYLAAFQIFCFVVARRKMASDRVHPLSKIQGIATLAIAAVLVLGAIWQNAEYDVLEIGALYVLVIGGIILTMMVTPNLAEYHKGLWRARKMNVRFLSVWDDHSPNRVFLMVGCAIIVIAASAAWYMGGAPESGSTLGSREYHLASATGVLTVASFGLALQFFLLRFGARGKMYFGLFLFLVWVVPVIVGSILLSTSFRPVATSDSPSAIVYARNPLIGLGLSASAMGSPTYRTMILGASLTPPLLYTFVFNSLLTFAIRRVRVEVAMSSPEGRKPVATPDLLLGAANS